MNEEKNCFKNQPCREKYFSELSIEDKIERSRDEINRLKSIIDKQCEELDRIRKILENHSHSNDNIVVPIDRSNCYNQEYSGQIGATIKSIYNRDEVYF